MKTKMYTYSVLSLLCALLQMQVTAVAKVNRVVATIGVGLNPAGIAVTADNKYAYVANNNNNQVPGADTVSVLDLKKNTVITTISDASFNQAYTVTINPAGTLAYVTNSYSTTITVIDIATNAVTGVIPGFNGPSGMVITPSGQFGYVNNYGAGGSSGTGTTVSVVNLNTNTITETITVGLAPAAVAITPDGGHVYVANYVNGNSSTGTISVISTASNTVVTTIAGGFSGPFAIAITPDGQYAYVTNFGSNNFAPFGTTVSVVSIATNTVIATIDVGIQPAGLAISPDGRYAYVSNYNTLYGNPVSFTDLTPGQGTVNVIDIENHNLIGPIVIGVGLSPANIAISPNGRYAYVTNYTSNNVYVLNILERMWL